MTREEKAEIAIAIRDDLPRHCPHLLRTLAFREAVKITKRAIAAQGLKLYDFSSAEIHKLAERYLTLHQAELVAEAIEIVRGDPEFMQLAVAETKRRGRYWPAKPKKPTKPPTLDYPISLEEQFAAVWQSLIDKSKH
jgi:hypothetical protein